MKYREYPNVEIPEFLKDWVDTSWHNDALASSECPDKTPAGHILIVWVNSDKMEEREPGLEASKYLVELRETESGDEIQTILAETEKEVLSAIETLRAHK